jgi:hypothetical protein
VASFSQFFGRSPDTLEMEDGSLEIESDYHHGDIAIRAFRGGGGFKSLPDDRT